MELGRLENLIYFVLVLAAAVVFLGGGRKKNRIYKSLNLLSGNSRFVELFLKISGLILLVFCLLEPKILKGTRLVEKKGLDIYFLVDVSKSMLSEDIKPSRLEKTKMTILELLDILRGDRIGFIPFAADAYVQMPLTDDYDLARVFLDSMDTEMISGGGTNISQALLVAGESFDQALSTEKLVFIFTDGEEHDSNALNVAQKLKGIRIYTIGVGTEKGELIPVYDESGKKNGFRKDNSGNYIVSKLNSELLRNLSEATKGKYYLSSYDSREIESLYEDIRFLKRALLKEDKVHDYAQLYQIFLGIGMILYLLGYFYEPKKKHHSL